MCVCVCVYVFLLLFGFCLFVVFVVVVVCVCVCVCVLFFVQCIPRFALMYLALLTECKIIAVPSAFRRRLKVGALE